MRQKRTVALIAGAVALSPGHAFANMGVPMIGLFLPPAWCLLLPIIVLEAAVGRWKLQIPLKAALLPQAVANGVSTLIGVPVVWVLLAVLELSCCGTARGLGTLWQRAYAVTIQAPWLIPYEEDLVWMVPIALGILSVLFCAGSIAIEYLIVRRMLAAEYKPHAWPWVVRANVASYAVLFVVTVAASLGGNSLGARRALMPVVDVLIDLVIRVAKAISG